MKDITIEAADLFCGAGGTSQGIIEACDAKGLNLSLLAVNHWPVAINSHTLNHPGVRHKCESLDTVRPRVVVPGGRLHLLAASPECTHHSNAAGGRPKNDQSRANGWHVVRWASELTIDNIMVENVWEFVNWGPLYHDHSNGCTAKPELDEKCRKNCHFMKPIPERKKEFFNAWIAALRGIGYRVEWRKQRAMDFGDPTSRARFMLLARRDNKPIVWPEATHGDGKLPYRTARQIIDWDLKGDSIFSRKKPLSKNTLRRIEAGLRKFGGANAKPFLIKLYGTNNVADIDKPLPAVTAGGNHLGVVEPQPFILPHPRTKGDAPRSVDEPLGTVTATSSDMCLVQPFLIGAGGSEYAAKPKSVDDPLNTVVTEPHIALVEPFVIGQQSCAAPRSVEEPLPTVAAKGAIALVEPFLVPYHSGKGRQDERAHSVDEPLRTQDTQNRHALVEPFIVHTCHGGGEGRCQSVDKPLPTVTGGHRGEMALIEPFVVQTDQTGSNGKCVRSVDEPVGTIVSKQNMALIQPFLSKYYGTGINVSVDEPLDTVTAKERFALVEPQPVKQGQVDILLRMLQPHELQAAMSFPKDYKFYGSKEQQVKQIGNAVPVQMAKAHAMALLG